MSDSIRISELSARIIADYGREVIELDKVLRETTYPEQFKERQEAVDACNQKLYTLELRIRELEILAFGKVIE